MRKESFPPKCFFLSENLVYNKDSATNWRENNLLFKETGIASLYYVRKYMYQV